MQQSMLNFRLLRQELDRDWSQAILYDRFFAFKEVYAILSFE